MNTSSDWNVSDWVSALPLTTAYNTWTPRYLPWRYEVQQRCALAGRWRLTSIDVDSTGSLMFVALSNPQGPYITSVIRWSQQWSNCTSMYSSADAMVSASPTQPRLALAETYSNSVVIYLYNLLDMQVVTSKSFYPTIQTAQGVSLNSDGSLWLATCTNCTAGRFFRQDFLTFLDPSLDVDSSRVVSITPYIPQTLTSTATGDLLFKATRSDAVGGGLLVSPLTGSASSLLWVDPSPRCVGGEMEHHGIRRLFGQWLARLLFALWPEPSLSPSSLIQWQALIQCDVIDGCSPSPFILCPLLAEQLHHRH